MLIILDIPGGKIFKCLQFSQSKLSLFIILVITDPQLSIISRDEMSFIQSHVCFSHIAFILLGEITSVELDYIFSVGASAHQLRHGETRRKSWEIYHLNWCKRQISEAKLSITPFQNPQKFHTLPLAHFGFFS